MLAEDDYSDGWVSRITDDDVPYEQFHRVTIWPGDKGYPVVKVNGIAVTFAENFAAGLEMARLQKEGFANDPPRVQGILGYYSYLAESEKYNTRQKIGRTAAFIHMTWARWNGR